jgi:hypothetical protein
MASQFLLNTDSVEAASSKINALSSNAEKALNSANGYDVSSSDFDFSPAISAIKANMKNIYEKVKVSSDILNKIIKIHSNLQDSAKETTKTTTTTTPVTYATPTYYTTSSTSGTPTPTSYTPSTPVVTPTTPTPTVAPIESPSPIPRPTDVYDYSKMIQDGKIEIVPKEDIEESTKERTKLIIRINRDDPKYEEYIKMVYEIAKMYGIVVGIVFIPDTAEDKTVSVALIKNGIEYGEVKGEDVTEEKIKALFENAPDEIKKDYRQENDFVYYKQGNYSNPYAGETIAAAGCGPTSAAMVLTYLKGEKIDPVTTSAWSQQHGYASNGNGTYEALFPAIGKAYGLNVVKQEQTATNIVNSLKQGNTIIAHMGPGEFTKGGHYIVLRKVDANGNVLVADPSNPARNKWYPASIFEEQRRGSIYSFSVPV